MLKRRVVAVLIVVAVVAVAGVPPARAGCGFPAVVISSVFPAPAGAPDTGFVMLFAPFAPFFFVGGFSVPTGTPFGDHAMNMAEQAVTTLPVNFMAFTGLGAPCTPFCAPPLAPVAFGICPANAVGLFP